MSTGDEPHVNADGVEEERIDPPVVIAEDTWLSWCDELRKIINLLPMIPSLDTTEIRTSLLTLDDAMNRKVVVP